MTALKHIAVLRHSSKVDDRTAALWTEAVRVQVEHAASDWGLPVPNVVYYGDSVKLPPSEAGVIKFVDNDGNDAAAGEHFKLGALIVGLVDLTQSAIPSRTFSHEALEMLGNPHLDRWIPGPNGLRYAAELCDPCQRDGYRIKVRLHGSEDEVTVSDYVLPSWFDSNAWGPYDHLGRIEAPHVLSEGGYAIAIDQDDELRYLAHPAGAFMSPAKLRRWARTARLLRREGETPA